MRRHAKPVIIAAAGAIPAAVPSAPAFERFGWNSYHNLFLYRQSASGLALTAAQLVTPVIVSVSPDVSEVPSRQRSGVVSFTR
jgi:hypothetical protein